jgi:hypothetical protein
MLAVTVVGRSTVCGQVALAVAADDASPGHARLNKLPMAEPACAVSASATSKLTYRLRSFPVAAGAAAGHSQTQAAGGDHQIGRVLVNGLMLN